MSNVTIVLQPKEVLDTITGEPSTVYVHKAVAPDFQSALQGSREALSETLREHMQARRDAYGWSNEDWNEGDYEILDVPFPDQTGIELKLVRRDETGEVPYVTIQRLLVQGTPFRVLNEG
jgi:hypothetical protein